MTWRDTAACVGADPEIFFPTGKHPDYTAAREICSWCPVRTECANDAINRESGKPLMERHGLQGNLTPEQRLRLDPKGPRTVKRSISEEGRELREKLYREGRSDTDIADHIGGSPEQVRAWRTNHGLPANDGNDINVTRREAFDRGLSDADIAALEGVTVGAIHAWRHRNGLSDRQLNPNHPALAPYRQGMSDPEIAEAIGWHPHSVRKWRNRNQLPPNRPAGGRRHADPIPLGHESDNRYQLWLSGLTDTEIAEQIGVLRPAIRRWRAKHGLGSREGRTA